MRKKIDEPKTPTFDGIALPAIVLQKNTFDILAISYKDASV